MPHVITLNEMEEGGASFSYELKTAFGHVSSHYYRREVVIQVFFCAYVDCNR